MMNPRPSSSRAAEGPVAAPSSKTAAGGGLDFSVGDRVQLVGTEKVARVRFAGAVPFSDGTWVGLELGDASGRNDGSVQGRRYFTCKPRHGLFVRAASCVKISHHSSSSTAAAVASPAHSSPPNIIDEPVVSTADVMLEKIQSILGSARKPTAIANTTKISPLLASSSSTTKSLVASSSPAAKEASSLPQPPPPLQIQPQHQAIIPTLAVNNSLDSSAVLRLVLESPELKKLIVAAVTTAVSSSSASSSQATAARATATSNALENAMVTGLEARIVVLEKSLENISTSLANIQGLVTAFGTSTSSPPRSASKARRADAGTETDDAEHTQGAEKDAEVARLKEALEVVSQLTREAKQGIIEERAKRREETEALLAQLAQHRKGGSANTTPTASPAR